VGQARGRQHRDRLQSHAASATALMAKPAAIGDEDSVIGTLPTTMIAQAAGGSPPTHTCLRGCVSPRPVRARFERRMAGSLIKPIRQPGVTDPAAGKLGSATGLDGVRRIYRYGENRGARGGPRKIAPTLGNCVRILGFPLTAPRFAASPRR
jgi:hypothetical protein